MSVMAGLFVNKNTLGQIMAVAILVELYLLVLGNWRPIWRFGLLSIYLTLLILSHSLTSLICGAFYLAGTAVYTIGRRDKLMGHNRCNHLGIAPALAATWLMVQRRLAAEFFW